jgi:PAS domain S-box-containing protein
VGRTTGAYRFIYPLKNTHNQHLGTVEISFGAREFVKAFIDTFKQPANVHFSKEILYKKSWEEFIDKNYNKLPFSDMYAEKSIQLLLMNYFENNQYQQLDVSKEFAIDLQRSIKNNLEHKTIVKYNETLNQVFVFLPIINPITKEFIGYFSTRSGADQITHTYSNFYIKFLFFALLIATVLYLAYKKLLINTNKNKILDSKIDKQKQELERRENIISKYVIYSRTNPKGIITDASEAFCELSGYTKEELVGNPHNIIRHPDVSSKVFEGMWANLKAEKPWEGEVLNKAKDQTDYWVYSKVSPEYDYDGNLIGYISVRNDITARKDYEKQQSFMQEQSKMAAMGDMIGNIAHQWRQPLTTIATKATGSIFQKEMGLLSDEVFHDNMESINESAQYLSQTIDIFRNFIRGSGEIVHVNVKKEIEDSFKIVEGSLKNYHITLNEYFEDGDFIVESKEGELVQVVINILNNAKDALLEKKIENPIIDIKLQKQNQQAIITIEDNAGGIPKDVLPKIFEPYFTTKHQSQGTGLGLQMSYEIITNSFHGKLYAKNTEKGAKFFIELPLMDLGY